MGELKDIGEDKVEVKASKDKKGEAKSKDESSKEGLDDSKETSEISIEPLLGESGKDGDEGEKEKEIFVHNLEDQVDEEIEEGDIVLPSELNNQSNNYALDSASGDAITYSAPGTTSAGLYEGVNSGSNNNDPGSAYSGSSDPYSASEGGAYTGPQGDTSSYGPREQDRFDHDSLDIRKGAGLESKTRRR